MKTTEDARKYAARQGIAEEQTSFKAEIRKQEMVGFSFGQPSFLRSKGSDHTADEGTTDGEQQPVSEQCLRVERKQH
jgi:hypothetical protein